MIAHADEVESYFGYWPLFCDGKIKSIAFIQPGTITLVIFYIDADKQKEAEVTLTFSGVTEVELSELRSENVIDALHISEELPIQVTLEACYGLAGGFKCAAAEVSYVLKNRNVRPNNLLQPTVKKLRFLPSGDFQRWASKV